MKRFVLTIAALLGIAAAEEENLLVEHPLAGSTENSVWSSLSSANTHAVTNPPNPIHKSYPDEISDESTEFLTHPPGYGASAGLYSWTGAYRISVSKTTSSFAIKHAVFQLDLVWDPATGFPHNGGPRLSYNNGNQNLAPLPMILGGSRQVENEVENVPEMEGIEHFVYRGVTWQWDLSQIDGDIHTVTINVPFANHTSVVAARLDIASEFEEISGSTSTPLQLWRETYFQTAANTGNAADQADPDGDGIPNLVEYALGTRPDSNDDDHGSSNLPALLTDGDRLRLAFRIPSSPPAELQYRVVVSSDLSSWKTLATKSGTSPWVWNGQGPSQIASETSIERQPFIIGDEIPVSSSPRFMRLEVSY